MKLFYDAEIYKKLDKPWDSVVRFIKVTLPDLGWSKGKDDIVMDVGCGPGRLTSNFILPCFPNLKKLIALDTVPDMIETAKSLYPHPNIDYTVANFENRSSVEQWKGQLTKFISIHCFNRLKDQRGAFQTVYELLQPDGEAAFLFLLHNGYYNAVVKFTKDPRWSSFFDFDVQECLPESQLKNYDSSHYKKIVEDLGFTVRHCQETQNVTTFLSDEDYITFCYSVCPLVPYIPPSKIEEFKKDLFFYITEENGRNKDGSAVDKTTTLELVLNK